MSVLAAVSNTQEQPMGIKQPRGGWAAVGFWLLCAASPPYAGAQIQSSSFLTPDGPAAGATDPFDWTRGDRGSSFAAWELFTTTTGPNSHFPDFGSPLPSSPILPVGGVATLTEAGAADVNDDGANDNGAFVTSTNNLYSLSAPIEIDVLFSGHGLGAGALNDTRFVAQVGTLGVPDDDTFTLQYVDDAGQTQRLPPDTLAELRSDQVGSPFGPTTLRETLLVWDVVGFNPGSFLFSFAASGASVSLDYLAVDTRVFLGPVGDYSNNGLLGQEDHGLFVTQFGSSTPNADGNDDGVVNAADYVVFRDSVATPSPAVAAAGIAVPEPTGGVLGAALVASLCGMQRTKRPRSRTLQGGTRR